MSTAKNFENKLYYGDNLEVMQALSDSFIDLIYIDPPFNSKRNYNILFEDMIESHADRNTAMKEAFSDTWNNVAIGSQLDEIKNENLNLYKILEVLRDTIDNSAICYLTMMSLRILRMRKLLKETGSFYLHCDPTMSHYLKIVCDQVFGKENFRNEIVWSYQRWTGKTRCFQRMHDTLLFYTKTKKYTYNFQHESYSLKSKHKAKRHSTLTSDKHLQQEYTEDTSREKLMRDVWEISIINAMAKERTGYPTQKPEALLERIIQSSSKEGDVVADFFCGCGTTIAVAERLKRKWLGVDISHLAVRLVEQRLLDQQLRENKPKPVYNVIGFPKDVAAAKQLASKDKGGRFRFQDWIIESCLLGHSKTKKIADGGIDGHMSIETFGEGMKYCIIEVKSGHTGIEQIRSFSNVLTKEKSADISIFVCFEDYISSNMRKAADQLGYVEGGSLFGKIPKMTIFSVENLLKKDYPQWLNVHINKTYTKKQRRAI